jgi:hypothetical protein
MTPPGRSEWHDLAMTDLIALQGWLDRYERAWRSTDAADIADLFAVDAVYRWRP